MNRSTVSVHPSESYIGLTMAAGPWVSVTFKIKIKIYVSYRLIENFFLKFLFKSSLIPKILFKHHQSNKG